MILVVLASGSGSRMGSLTKKTPKCLVKIFKNKSTLDFLSTSFKSFEKVIITTGYKSKMIEKKIKFTNVKFIKNKNYSNTNMVESLMQIENNIPKNQDIIVTYSDIYFDHEIFFRLKNIKGNCLALNKKWREIWIKRFKTKKNIIKDAEDLKVKNGIVSSIGGRIGTKLPHLQYTGIFKIDAKSFGKMLKFYKALKDKKINMTKFINKVIQKKIAKFKYIIINSFWYEIDNEKDLKVLIEDLKKIK